MIEAFALQVDPQTVADGVNYSWILTVTFLIFFMHAGFAMLEAGQVRAKNVANQLTKNMLTWSVGVVVFFLVGAGVEALVGQVLGTGDYTGLGQFGAGSAGWIDWLYGAVFAMTAATIVSGAVAGRAKLRAYVSYTFVLAAVIYPVVTGLTWAGGFVETTLGFHDFAGGMIVHGVGGIAGLTAAWLLGPRLDRFTDDGSVNVIPGHSMTFAVLGTLVLCFGWYGFNVGTAATVFTVEDGVLALGDFGYVGSVALVTTLGMAMGAIGAGGMALARTGKVDTLYVANGMLAGLVGVTGTADVLTPMGGLALGLIAGAQLPLVFEIVEKRLRIDDVCAVFPVHGSAGVLGVVLYPLWSTSGTPIGGGLVAGGVLSIEPAMFAPQVFGTAIIGVWTVGATAVVWGAFKAVGQARVTPDHEREGLDLAEHGTDTYPEFGRGDAVADGGLSLAETNGIVRPDGGVANDGGIKLVTAFVRPDKLTDVKQGLAEVGAPSLSVTNVSGRGSQPAKTGQWRGEEYTVDLHQKVKIECVVADIPAGEVAQAIRDAAHTGEPGDGKVFVLPVEDAYQIRTGEVGPSAV